MGTDVLGWRACMSFTCGHIYSSRVQSDSTDVKVCCDKDKLLKDCLVQISEF